MIELCINVMCSSVDQIFIYICCVPSGIGIGDITMILHNE